MEEFKKPDLKAPRFRKKQTNLLNEKLFKQFKLKYPKYKKVQYKTFRKIIESFHEDIIDSAIEKKDGVKLPYDLGFLIVVKCKNENKESVDFFNSLKYGKKINFTNWESEGYLAKLCYTNYSLKYFFADRELWSFTACRNFKKKVSENFAENYSKYIHLDKNMVLARLY